MKNHSLKRRNISFLINTLLILIFHSSISAAFGQNSSPTLDTLTFKVEGVCNMCKQRIENAALVKGVRDANWNKETKIITVIYKPSKTDETKIHHAIAEMGHATEKVKVSDAVYKKLPTCCAYKDGIETH